MKYRYYLLYVAEGFTGILPPFVVTVTVSAFPGQLHKIWQYIILIRENESNNPSKSVFDTAATIFVSYISDIATYMNWLTSIFFSIFFALSLWCTSFSRYFQSSLVYGVSVFCVIFNPL